MKLHADRHADLNAITAYGDGWVEVSSVRHHGALLVRPQGPVLPWDVTDFSALTPDILLALAGPEIMGPRPADGTAYHATGGTTDGTADDAPSFPRPEVILLGTGSRLHFPHPSLTHPLQLAGIGLEAMDTVAACRTYNILMAEGRQVLAALLPTA